MTEPTEGEWITDGTMIHSANGMTVAEVFGDDDGQRIANARITAASKDLLAACETYLAYARHGGSVVPPGVEAMRGAVRKARGDSA